jgi:thiamine biosynthesis lipoprotein
MGVPFRIVLYARDEATARNAAEAAFTRVSQLNAILSDYDTDSELNQLSRTAGEDRWVVASPDLWTVLERAQIMAQRSYGAFDITVGPCVSLWRKARREQKMPDEQKLTEARAAVGYQKLLLDWNQRAVKLLVPDMRLDLGGIAKGYAVEEAMQVLLARGITRALVAAAGDMAMSDPPPDKSGWRIELPPLDGTNTPEAQIIMLRNAAVSTSGDAFQFVELGGKRYSHIVDPRTGIGLTDHSLVNIIAPDCTTADALATAISVLGPEAGLPLIRDTPGVRARVMRQPVKEVERFDSPNWPK